jgi:hypothetical protein
MRKLSREEKTRVSPLQPYKKIHRSSYYVDTSHIMIDLDAEMMQTATITPLSVARSVDEQIRLSCARYRQRAANNRIAKMSRRAARCEMQEENNTISQQHQEQQQRDIRDAVRSFFRSNDWVGDLSDNDQDQLQLLIANQIKGHLSSSDFRLSVKTLRETVRSSTVSSYQHTPTNWAAGSRGPHGGW